MSQEAALGLTLVDRGKKTDDESNQVVRGIREWEERGSGCQCGRESDGQPSGVWVPIRSGACPGESHPRSGCQCGRKPAQVKVIQGLGANAVESLPREKPSDIWVPMRSRS